MNEVSGVTDRGTKNIYVALTVAPGITRTIQGDVVITGDLNVQAAGVLVVNGKLQVYGTVTNAGTITCLSLDSPGNVNNDAGVNLIVNGDCQIGGNLANSIGTITINGKCSIAGTYATTLGVFTCQGDFRAASITTVDPTNVSVTTINGNCYCTGAITIGGAANFTILGNVFADGITVSIGSLVINGNCQTANDINLTGATAFGVNGDCQVGADFTNDVTATYIGGNTEISGNITITTGSFTCNGNVKAQAITTTDLTSTGSVDIGGNLQCSAAVTVGGAISFEIGGNLQCVDITITLDGLTVGGNCQAHGLVDLTGATNFEIHGDCYISGSLINDTSTTDISGILRVSGNISNGTGALTYQALNPETPWIENNIDLNQAADDYDLFTARDEPVYLENLVISCPDAAAAGALTSISIQTDHTTPQVIISAAAGIVGNLTAQAQLAWIGNIRIEPGKKIQLTIAGGATGVAYSCIVKAQPARGRLEPTAV
jgi:hypothetical protein